jgi:hypothetical protein
MGVRASFQKRVEVALSALVGMPVWDARRALNMEMFDIGDRLEVVNRRRETVQIGTYRLHVQAPWRVVGPRGVVAGSVDAHYPPSDRSDDADFDPNNDRSLCEERVGLWLARRARKPLIIRSVEADPVGGFRLLFDGGETLEVIPASSARDYEHWRLLGPGADRPPHFVVTGRRAQRLGTRP